MVFTSQNYGFCDNKDVMKKKTKSNLVSYQQTTVVHKSKKTYTRKDKHKNKLK